MRLCNLCKDIQESCCQGTSITLTQGDVSRISQASGRDDFFELRHHADLSFLDLYNYDPNWKTYLVLPGNRIRQLKMDSRGHCLFLGDGGCLLSEETRPLACRLYPHNYNEYGMIGLVLNEDMICPNHLVKDGEDLYDWLELSREQADRWRTMYYEELRAEYRERENRPDGETDAIVSAL